MNCILITRQDAQKYYNIKISFLIKYIISTLNLLDTFVNNNIFYYRIILTFEFFIRKSYFPIQKKQRKKLLRGKRYSD
jgi:hypothetical protein